MRLKNTKIPMSKLDTGRIQSDYVTKVKNYLTEVMGRYFRCSAGRAPTMTQVILVADVTPNYMPLKGFTMTSTLSRSIGSKRANFRVQ